MRNFGQAGLFTDPYLSGSGGGDDNRLLKGAALLAAAGLLFPVLAHWYNAPMQGAR